MYGLLTGIGIICIIIGSAQIAIWNGDLHYEMLPTSIDGCSNETVVVDSIRNINKGADAVDDTFAIYKISFMWYGLDGSRTSERIAKKKLPEMLADDTHHAQHISRDFSGMLFSNCAVLLYSIFFFYDV